MSAAGLGQIRHEIRDAAGWVTMSNPARRNALSMGMLGELETTVRGLDQDPAVHVIVLQGAGETFTAGADISEFETAKEQSADARHAHADAVTRLFLTFGEIATPVIAMIRGYCLGAGMALALSADLRIAAEGSRFGIPAARLGIGYPVTLGQSLVHVVGPAHASDILFTGRTLDDAEAARVGLVNRVVSPDRLAGDVAELVAVVAANAPLSVRAAKATIKASFDPGLAPRAHEFVASCVGSGDEREGQSAFLERRPPSFKGA